MLGSTVFLSQILLVTEAQRPLEGTSVHSLGQGDGLQGWRVSQRLVGSRGKAKLETCRVGKQHCGPAN